MVEVRRAVNECLNIPRLRDFTRQICIQTSDGLLYDLELVNNKIRDVVVIGLRQEIRSRVFSRGFPENAGHGQIYASTSSHHAASPNRKGREQFFHFHPQMDGRIQSRNVQ